MLDAVRLLGKAATELDALIVKGASAGDLALASLECEFYGAELTQLAVRLKAAACEDGLRAVS